jgi:hypothetical protein
MADDSVYHVVPDEAHGWKVRLEGSDVGSQAFDSQAEAIDKARQLAQMAKGGRVVVHRQDGAIDEAQSYRQTG